MKGLCRARFAMFPLSLAALFVFLAVPGRAERVADLAQPTDYVSDYAHVLSPDAIARLDAICSQLDHSQANAQIAIVTVHDLDGDDAADYADELETKWKMGKKGSDRGALVLLAVADRKYQIEVGYGLEGILPDGKVGDIGRSMIPDLRAGDYDGAVTDAVGQMAQVIAEDAHVTLETNTEPALAVEPHRQPAPSAGKVILGIIIAIWIIFHLLRGFGGYGLLGAWGLGLLSGGMSNQNRGGFFGGGGFSGGGGGGGGFGGFGGGGFGGGGAGGSW
ncbi:MAG: TPM domain-containing protein [Terracidiphilus sp.]